MTIEDKHPELGWDLPTAKFVWSEAARVQALHEELASLYRTNGDKRVIKLLWQKIDEGEAGLRALGVYV